MATYLAPDIARGVDGANFENFSSNKGAELSIINRKVLSGTYKFTPFREKLILKRANQIPRQVSIPTIRDRVTLRALNNFLADVFPDARPMHSHHTVSAAIQSIGQAGPHHSFIKLDIETFYDDINHDLLLENLYAKACFSPFLELVRSALSTPTGLTLAARQSRSKGVPQGLSVSNILASIYLKEIDDKYKDYRGIQYYRYVDDILCIAPTEHAKRIAAEITSDLLQNRRLTVHKLNGGKSAIFSSSARIEYLGYVFEGKIVSVRDNSVQKLLNGLMRMVHTTEEAGLLRTIWGMNLRISGCQYQGKKIGWMFYFSQINDLSLLAQIDSQLKKAMQWKFGHDKVEQCKRLLKTYYEIKYNLRDTAYIPNFDITSDIEKERVLERIDPNRKYTAKTLQEKFDRLINREIRDMERDTIGALS
ncbi:MAG: reverse transcriptase domain-containing protein [Acetobacteraceae bacterium]|nr:reverse transcriptase/maturase family protein [Roseomonas sp.]